MAAMRVGAGIVPRPTGTPARRQAREAHARSDQAHGQPVAEKALAPDVAAHVDVPANVSVVAAGARTLRFSDTQGSAVQEVPSWHVSGITLDALPRSYLGALSALDAAKFDDCLLYTSDAADE